MQEVWDIYGRESQPTGSSRGGSGWRLKVQATRDEQREREAMGLPAKRDSAKGSTQGRAPSGSAQRTKR